MDKPDKVTVRLKELKEYGDGPLTDLITVNLRNKPRKFIDVLVKSGYYMNRSEFIRMAIDQKIEKIIVQLNDPFYKELMQE